MLLAFFGPLGPMELTVLLILGVLLFGRKLPEVGRSLGKGIMEFKKGMKGLEDDVDGYTRTPEPMIERPQPPQRVTATAPKFEDPTVPTTPSNS